MRTYIKGRPLYHEGIRIALAGFCMLFLTCAVESLSKEEECANGLLGRATLIVIVTEPAVAGLRVSLFNEMLPDKRIATQPVALVPGTTEFSRLCPGKYAVELSASDCSYGAKRRVKIRGAETKKVKLHLIKQEIPCE